MSKLKRVLSVILVVALVAAASVAGTVTYLTDRDKQANVFTLGNVDIRLSDALEMGVMLVPGTEIEKDITVRNTGRNAAWVWVSYAIPEALDNTGAIHLTGTDTEAWEVYTPANNDMTVNGKAYKIHTFLLKEKLMVLGTTAPCMSKISMDSSVDVNPDGNICLVGNSQQPMELSWNVYQDGTPVIYISAYAIQTEGFDTVNAAYAGYGQQWGDGATTIPTSSLYELMTSDTAVVFNALDQNTGKKAASSTVGVTGNTINFGTVLTQDSLDAIGIADSTMSSEELRKIVLDYFKLQQSFLYTPTEEVPMWPAAAGSTALNQEYFETYVDPNYVFDQVTGKAFHEGTIYAGMPYVNSGYGTLYRWLNYYDQDTGEMDLAQAIEDFGGMDNTLWKDGTLYTCNWYTEENYNKWDSTYDAAKEGWLYTSAGPKEPLWSEKDGCWYITATNATSLINDSRMSVGISAYEGKTVNVGGKNYLVVEKGSDGKWRPVLSAAAYTVQQALGNACSQGAATAWNRVINSAMLEKAGKFNAYNGLIPVGLFDFEYSYNGQTYSMENMIEFGKADNSNPLGASADEVAKYWIGQNATVEAKGLGQSIYECYALVEPADALAHDGHVMMVTGVHVVRNADGSIDPEQSYITVYEQDAVLGFYGSIVDEDGTSANYMVHGSYVSDFDDEKNDSVYKRNGNYGERYYSFKSLLFGTKAADSIENITSPYLPWTFAEFHYKETDQQSQDYINYYMNTVPESRATDRYNNNQVKAVVTGNGFVLKKENEADTFAGIGVETAHAYAAVRISGGRVALVYPNTPVEITASQFEQLAFVANYYMSDITVEIKDAEGNLVETVTGLHEGHYQMFTVVTQYKGLCDAVAEYHGKGYTAEISIQLYNGQVIPVFTGNLT